MRVFIIIEHKRIMYKALNIEDKTTQETREVELLDKAREVLYATTGIRLVVEQFEPIAKDTRIDALGRIIAYGVDIPLVIEIKLRPTKTILGGVAQQLRQYPGQGMLVADYINPLMAERLKELNIWFLDAVGNAYINQPPICIYIKGNKPTEKFEKEVKNRAFQPTGLKIIFTFFCNPNLVNAPYRDIAHAANVALGTVGWVMRDLKELGYLIEPKKRDRYLTRKKELLDRWVTAYPEQLRPKLVIGKYTTNETAWWKNKKLQNLNAYMGGEIAAEYLTHYLKPYRKTIYVRGPAREMEVAFKLWKQPEGDVELLKTFWNEECEWQDNKIVHPILIYADLLATGDPRNIETAEIIYEREIAEYIRED